MKTLYAVIEIVDGVEEVSAERLIDAPAPSEIRQINGKPKLRPIVQSGLDSLPSVLRPLASFSYTIGNAEVQKVWTVDVTTGREMAKRHVDSAAEQARLAFITPGDGQAMVYRQKQDEAAEWLAKVAAEETPDPSDFVMLKARAERLDAEDPDYQAVASEWATQAAIWKNIAAHIEDVREGAKEAIASATASQLITIIEDLDFTIPA